VAAVSAALHWCSDGLPQSCIAGNRGRHPAVVGPLQKSPPFFELDIATSLAEIAGFK